MYMLVFYYSISFLMYAFNWYFQPGINYSLHCRCRILVVLSNDRGPLGIHVIPSTDGRGQDQGLLVEGVEQNGRIARDGRIEVHDRIVEINGRHLNNITFQK